MMSLTFSFLVVDMFNWFASYMHFFFFSMGLDLAKGAIRNNLEAGVIEPAMSKVKILQVNIQSQNFWWLSDLAEQLP